MELLRKRSGPPEERAHVRWVHHPPDLIHAGNHSVHQAKPEEKLKLPALVLVKEPDELGGEPAVVDAPEELRVPHYALPGAIVKMVSRHRGEAHGSEEPHRVVAEALPWIAYEPHPALGQILQPVKRIEDHSGEWIKVKRVYRKVAGHGVIHQRAVAVVPELPAPSAVLPAEGRNLDSLLSELPHYDDKAPAERPGARNCPHHIGGPGLGRDVEVGRGAACERVAHGTSDNEGAVPLFLYAPDDGKRVGADHE